MRPLFVKFAGRIIGKHAVAWYDEDPLGTVITSYFNTGDICVSDSTLRLVNYNQGKALNIDQPVEANVVRTLRERCDYILLRGSNYLHEEMDWGYFGDWLEALDLPVLCIGVGAQAAHRRDIKLPAASQRVWKAIAERAASIGVRGSFSADVLHLNGIHNVEIVGCPSIFRGLNPTLTLRHQPAGPKRVTFSVRREVGFNYALDPEGFVATQKRIIAKLAMVSDLYLSCHGEPEEKAFFYRSPQLLQQAAAKLTAEGWFDDVSGPTLRDLYERRLYYVSSPSDGDFYATQFDAAVGYRVHAILPTVALGTPGVLFAYDTRSQELAETFDLPIYTPSEFEKLTLTDAFEASRFSTFEEKFGERYAHMKSVIEANGVPTRM